MANTGLLKYGDRFTNYIVNQITTDTTGDSADNEMELDAESQYHLVISLTGQEYSNLLSSVLTGADLLFGDEAQQLTWILWKAAKMGTLCEQVANCIANSPDVQYELQLLQATEGGNGGGGTPDEVLPEEERERNILPDGYDCDLDRLYATSRGVVQAVNDSVEEIFQAIEVLTNPLELANELADNVPIAELVAFATDTIAWIQDAAAEAYDLAWSEVVKDTISCELFCLLKEHDPCSLSLEDLMTVYKDVSFPDAPDIFDGWLVWAEWLYQLPLVAAVDTVKTAGLLGILCMRFGATFGKFSLGIRSLETVVALLANETDGDWQVLCTACDDLWIHEWDFTNYGMDGWGMQDVGNPSGIWDPLFGFVGETLEFGGTWSNAINVMSWLEVFQIPRLTHFRIIYDMNRGNWNSGDPSFALDATGGTYQEWNSGFAQTGSGQEKQIVFPAMSTWNLIAFVRSSRWNTADGAGLSAIRRVELEGIGEDPFFGRVTADRHIGES